MQVFSNVAGTSCTIPTRKSWYGKLPYQAYVGEYYPSWYVQGQGTKTIRKRSISPPPKGTVNSSSLGNPNREVLKPLDPGQEVPKPPDHDTISFLSGLSEFVKHISDQQAQTTKETRKPVPYLYPSPGIWRDWIPRSQPSRLFLRKSRIVTSVALGSIDLQLRWSIQWGANRTYLFIILLLWLIAMPMRPCSTMYALA